MLDDLLGRGFSSKAKSLLKVTKTRIEAVRKKRNATQKFLKKDIADLLANGLDMNAFGRAEGLVNELMISSCYDFVEHCCDCVLKNLSALQKKKRECLEECKVAVASLMFAAARFSDLPELRDLRQIFQGRYGNALKLHINQKFVKNLSPNPASTENKLQLMQDIASQYSVVWNAKAFEQRMSNSHVSAPKEHLDYGSFCGSENGIHTASNYKKESGNCQNKVNNISLRETRYLRVIINNLVYKYSLLAPF
uniref:IST1-like protein n=1 Tax=Kalanchoe fedtschenkoi TaxID=63787 RepID=A0A7N0ZS60_KALFE